MLQYYIYTVHLNLYFIHEDSGKLLGGLILAGFELIFEFWNPIKTTSQWDVVIQRTTETSTFQDLIYDSDVFIATRRIS